MGFFSRWPFFPLDGLLFEIGFFPLDGLLFEMAFFPLDGLLFEMAFFPLNGLLFDIHVGFYSRLVSFRTFANSRGGLLFKIDAANIELNDYKTMIRTTAQVFQPRNMLKC